MKKTMILSFLIFLLGESISAQQVTLSKDQLIALTNDWKGERSADGRPRVEDRFLERLKAVHLEEAWGILRNKGYKNQFEGEWMVIHPD